MSCCHVARLGTKLRAGTGTVSWLTGASQCLVACAPVREGRILPGEGEGLAAPRRIRRRIHWTTIVVTASTTVRIVPLIMITQNQLVASAPNQAKTIDCGRKPRRVAIRYVRHETLVN